MMFKTTSRRLTSNSLPEASSNSRREANKRRPVEERHPLIMILMIKDILRIFLMIIDLLRIF